MTLMWLREKMRNLMLNCNQENVVFFFDEKTTTHRFIHKGNELRDEKQKEQRRAQLTLRTHNETHTHTSHEEKESEQERENRLNEQICNALNESK